MNGCDEAPVGPDEVQEALDGIDQLIRRGVDVERKVASWRAQRRYAMLVGSPVVIAGWMMRLFLIGSLALVTAAGTAVVEHGVGVCFAVMPLVINEHAPRGQIAAANSLDALARSIGISMISALRGSSLATMTAVVPGAGALPTLAAYRWVFVLYATGAFVAAGREWSGAAEGRPGLTPG